MVSDCQHMGRIHMPNTWDEETKRKMSAAAKKSWERGDRVHPIKRMKEENERLKKELESAQWFVTPAQPTSVGMTVADPPTSWVEEVHALSEPPPAPKEKKWRVDDETRRKMSESHRRAWEKGERKSPVTRIKEEKAELQRRLSTLEDIIRRHRDTIEEGQKRLKPGNEFRALLDELSEISKSM